MYDSDLTISTSPLTSSAPYSGLRPVTSTILRTEFLLQFWKQREDSAILLASNRPHNKDQTKKQRKTKREENSERVRTRTIMVIMINLHSAVYCLIKFESSPDLFFVDK
jgi:hypothetical protein